MQRAVKHAAVVLAGALVLAAGGTPTVHRPCKTLRTRRPFPRQWLDPAVPRRLLRPPGRPRGGSPSNCTVTMIVPQVGWITTSITNTSGSMTRAVLWRTTDGTKN